MAQIIAKCWADPAFKARFLAEPGVVLQEAGVEIPYGTNVHVHEAAEGERHLVLPQVPTGANPRDVPLDAIVPLLTYYHNKMPKPKPAKPKPRKPKPGKPKPKPPKKGGRKGGKRKR